MNPTESLSFSRAKIAARGAFWMAAFTGFALVVAVWQMWGNLDGLRADLATARDEIEHVRQAAQADYDANAWWKDTCHTFAHEDRMATDAKVKRLEARIETLESDIESTKRVQDLWDQLTLDDIIESERKIKDLTDKVETLNSEIAKPGELVWKIKVSPVAEMSVVSVPCTTMPLYTGAITNSTTTINCDAVALSDGSLAAVYPKFNACTTGAVCR